jgi:hypothetical protein
VFTPRIEEHFGLLGNEMQRHWKQGTDRWELKGFNGPIPPEVAEKSQQPRGGFERPIE